MNASEKLTLHDLYKKTEEQPSGCIVWSGSNGKRYGRVRVRGRMCMAHRVSWTLSFGTIPDGMFVCHKCDNPPCINPDHLFLGTALDNVRDMKSKKRHLYGARANGAKLTAKDAIAIYGDVRSQSQISKEYGISQTEVSLIKRGRVWTHATQGQKCSLRKWEKIDEKIAFQIFHDASPRAKIAKDYCVSIRSVENIKQKRSWKQIHEATHEY